MASELRVNTLKDASGNNSVGMSCVAEGTVKAWHEANGNAASNHIADSFNIASFTDNGTGSYSVSFTNNMSTAAYLQVASSNQYHAVPTGGGHATTGHSYQVFSNANVQSDAGYIGGSATGDLA